MSIKKIETDGVLAHYPSQGSKLNVLGPVGLGIAELIQAIALRYTIPVFGNPMSLNPFNELSDPFKYHIWFLQKDILIHAEIMRLDYKTYVVGNHFFPGLAITRALCASGTVSKEEVDTYNGMFQNVVSKYQAHRINTIVLLADPDLLFTRTEGAYSRDFYKNLVLSWERLASEFGFPTVEIKAKEEGIPDAIKKVFE